MDNEVVLLDGAIGTSLWEKTENKVAVWRYNIENPGIVKELHEEYVDAGSQIIATNTFGANATNVKGTGYEVKDIVKSAVEIAKSAVAGRARIALDVGPLSNLLEPYGDISLDAAFQTFDEQTGYGVESGADLIFFETFMDIEMMKIALKAANQHDIPVFCSFSFDQKGRTMMGNSVKDIIEALKSFRIDAIGLNCSLGPDAAVPVIEEFKRNTDLPLIFKPNAGKSTVSDKGEVVTEYDVDTFINDSVPALKYGVKYIGGCCGTNTTYIKKLKEKLAELNYIK